MKQKTMILFACIGIALCGISPEIEAGVMEKAKLDKKQQSIAPIAAFTAKGDMGNLKTALEKGLDAGLSINEVKEVLVQMYAYCGFPRSLNALAAFSAVLKEREEKGIKDEVGKFASPLPADKTSLALGTANQTALVGAPVQGGLMDFAPAVDEFLKAHLFGDIFGRDNLDWQSREIATVSALAAMDGVESQLQAHCSISMNIGITVDEMQHLAAVLEEKVGKGEGSRAREALEMVLKP